MDFDDVLRARFPVEPAHVLRQPPYALEAALGLRQDRMRAVERRSPYRGLDLVDVFPGERGVLSHHLPRESLLDGTPFGSVRLFVEPSDAAIRGKPGVRGNAGTGV